MTLIVGVNKMCVRSVYYGKGRAPAPKLPCCSPTNFCCLHLRLMYLQNVTNGSSDKQTFLLAALFITLTLKMDAILLVE